MGDEKLVLNTKKSLYEPIEIEIDGKTYQSMKTTRAVLNEINQIDEELQKNPLDDELLYKAVQLLFDVDIKILNELDKREVQDIYNFSKQKFFEVEKQRIELINNTFGKMIPIGTREAKKKIPSQKRPGNKH